DESGSLRSLRSNTNGTGLCSNTHVADVDIVTAGGQVKASAGADCDVVRSNGVFIKRCVPQRRIVSTGGVGEKRDYAIGRVANAGAVIEGLVTGRGVAVSGGVA